MPAPSQPPHPAVVSRSTPSAHARDQYLLMTDGAPAWTEDVAAATAFDSMREATRAAMRLPGALRAYSLPRPDAAASPRDLN